MPAEEVRYMRLLVFFDLPVKTKDDQREANRFRNFLLRDGYDRVQLSVYARVCRGPENVETHIRRLQKNLPPHGCVRLLQVTEKQYGRMRLLVGTCRSWKRRRPRNCCFSKKCCPYSAPYGKTLCSYRKKHCFLQ